MSETRQETKQDEGWTKNPLPSVAGSTASTTDQQESPSREEWAIAVVEKLRHRVGARRSCRCEECRALIQVLTLAREAIAMKNSRCKWASVRE